MKRLIMKAEYGREFTHNNMPRLFLKLINTELSNPLNITILTYIRDNYNINRLQLSNLLRDNLRVSGYRDNVIIYFSNAKIKEEILEDGSIKVTYLETVLNLLDYGNLEVRGANIINNIINYLESHIDSLYRLSRVRRRSNIWV